MRSRVVSSSVALLLAASPHVPDILGGTGGEDSDAEVAVTAGEEAGGSDPQWPVSAQGADAGPADRYQRHPMCEEWYVGGDERDQRTMHFVGTIPDCAEVREPPADMCPGQTPLYPLWVSRVVDPAGPEYGPWTAITGPECPADPLLPAIINAWRQMVITPQPIELTPDYGWAIAGLGVEAATEDAAQTTTVTILGTPVMLRATPSDHDWTVTEIGTGTTGTVEASHITFDRREHRVHLGLTTTWEGHYSLDGGTTWNQAPGTATTTTEPASLHVFNPRTRLVNCDSDGNCRNGGTPDNPFTLTDPDADGIDNHTISDDNISAYLDTRAADRTWRD